MPIQSIERLHDVRRKGNDSRHDGKRSTDRRLPPLSSFRGSDSVPWSLGDGRKEEIAAGQLAKTAAVVFSRRGLATFPRSVRLESVTKLLALLALSVVSLAALAVSTQAVAVALHCGPALGPPWLTLGATPVYPPWAWLLWPARFEPVAPDAFRTASDGHQSA